MTEPTSTLALSYRRADVFAFWLLATIVAALSVTGAASWLHVRSPYLPGAVAALLLVLPGLLWRPWFEFGIRCWNGVVRRVAAVLRQYVLAVCYYIFFGAVGVSGSAIARRNLSGSRWIPRAAAVPRGGADAFRTPQMPEELDLLAFARMPGNRWAVALLPIVFLLRVLRDDEQESAVPGSTYTLY